MNDPRPQNWQQLTALARQAQAPGVEVSIAVQAAIRALPAPVPPSVVDILSSFASSRGWQAALACLIGLAALAGYQGMENADVLQFTLGFSL